MDVYQVPNLARCHLLATTFREGAQQWFPKLGPRIITSWEQMKTLFLTQFQASLKYTPPITTLAIWSARGNRFLKKHLQGKDHVSLADVLAQAESFKSIDKKKYCEYHESTGHDTHEFHHLKDEIEELINDGYLGEWIDKVKRRRGDDDKGKDERHPPQADVDEKPANIKFQRAGSIRAIFGGHPFIGDSNRALERKAREARHQPLTNIYSLEDRPQKIFKEQSADINFRERESRWVHHPHNDVSVITMLIGTMDVHRVFLDNGSSAKFLYYSTYKKLGFPNSYINFEDAHVYGFTVEVVRIMGSIRLPVTIGESAPSVTQMIKFKVLDQESMHNVLIGRPWLQSFRMITSIHHLMINFPMPIKVGRLRGSQYESRDCYHKAVKEFHRRRYEGNDLPEEDATNIQVNLNGEVHTHYFMEDP
ncbi:uncharacterized protein LOC141660666 [Apium graveolens]|uniref:uncharacterized protein LOC141660666 n=1 Tax=Apium graveolens TaxID=4045 RepID=UPI003D7A1769